MRLFRSDKIFGQHFFFSSEVTSDLLSSFRARCISVFKSAICAAMNEEERRRHKERRKRQKKRRNERKREEAKQARIADHQKRIEAGVDRVVEKCIERGELVRVRAGQSREQKAGANDEPRGPARPVNNEGETSRKRVSQSRPSEDVPRKAAGTSPHIKEISSYRVTLTEKHVGSGSYGSCYVGDFRGLKIVVKTLRVRQMQGESVGDAEKRVGNELFV